MSMEEWKNRYIFTEIPKIFFVSFAHELKEWMAQLLKFQNCWKDDQVTQWTPELTQQLEKTDNKITKTMDHWVDSILDGFVTKFVFNQFISYSEVE